MSNKMRWSNFKDDFKSIDWDDIVDLTLHPLHGVYLIGTLDNKPTKVAAWIITPLFRWGSMSLIIWALFIHDNAPLRTRMTEESVEKQNNKTLFMRYESSQDIILKQLDKETHDINSQGLTRYTYLLKNYELIYDRVPDSLKRDLTKTGQKSKTLKHIFESAVKNNTRRANQK